MPEEIENKGYVWYSSAYDVSGKKLASSLHLLSGRKQAGSKIRNIINWGNSEWPDAHDGQPAPSWMNHPGAVEMSKDKGRCLHIWATHALPVPPYTRLVDSKNIEKSRSSVAELIQDGYLTFPLVGFSRHHRGGPALYFSEEEVLAAIASQELEYVRSYVAGTEYRIHVFRGETIFVQKKVWTGEFSLQNGMEKDILRLANKKKVDVDLKNPQAALILETFRRNAAEDPKRLIRGVGSGWKLEDVDRNEKDLPEVAHDCAAAALAITTLDFGAVSVVLNKDVPLLTNVVAAPSLDSADICQAYSKAIRDAIKNKKADYASNEVLGQIKQRTAGKFGEESLRRVLISSVSRRLRKLDNNRLKNLLKELDS